MAITLRRIQESDLEKIMNWRMQPEVTQYMNTNPKLTLEGQKQWFARIKDDPDVAYYMIVVDGTEAGVLNLTGLCKEDGVIGWAYYVGENQCRSLNTALVLETGMYDYVFDTLGKKAVISDVFTLNKGVIRLHLLCGAEILEEKKAHIEKEGVLYDVTFMRMTAEKWSQVKHQKGCQDLEFPR